MAAVESLAGGEARFGMSARGAAPGGHSPTGVQARLFLTCWLVFALHFSPFVARELYLTLALAERGTVHVDEYLGLHADLFEIPGRGTYMGGNPGVSLLAVIPYKLALPLIERVAPVRPPAADDTAKAEYKEDRPNRQRFYQLARERGLDLRLGAAAGFTAVFFMAPLTAASAVVIFRLLLHLGLTQSGALWMSFLYAFGTPVFFRTGIMSLNLLVTLLGLFAFVLLWWPAEEGSASARRRAKRWPGGEPLRYFTAGLLAGYAVLTDYTGVITLGMLGLFAAAEQWRRKPPLEAIKGTLWFAAGAVGPVAFLLFYQWYCYGNPWLPAQFHQPAKQYVGYPSARGFGWPLPAALWGLLFDPLYGLLVFAPIFALALYHPLLRRRGQSRVPSRVALFAWLFFAALSVFCSMIHYTLRHQWQEGVRYMVPAVPFLFLLVAEVLRRIPRAVAYLAAGAAVAETWCLAMVRESPLESVARVMLHGFELPWLTTLSKAAAQYFPLLGEGYSPLPVMLLAAAGVWLIWRVREPWKPVEET